MSHSTFVLQPLYIFIVLALAQAIRPFLEDELFQLSKPMRIIVNAPNADAHPYVRGAATSTRGAR
jgi:hypothetical protein